MTGYYKWFVRTDDEVVPECVTRASRRSWWVCPCNPILLATGSHVWVTRFLIGQPCINAIPACWYVRRKASNRSSASAAPTNWA